MKKILFTLLTFFCLMSVTHADSIYNIDMDIYLDENGTANITEVWDVKADGGTEWYKQLYNLGNEELFDFKASMDGNDLQYKNWNIDESLTAKRGYYGINYVSEGLELCFGKGDMNRHEFTLNYKLSNFIINTDDAQGLYQTLLPNVTLDNFNVTVRSFYEFPNSLEVWGFGYQGLAYVEDGKIKMTNDGYPVNNNYVVLLAKFPTNTFSTENRSDNFKTFNDLLSTAKEGSYEYDYGTKETILEKIFNFISFLISVIFPLGIFGIAVAVAQNSGYGYKDNKTIDKKNTPMFREIPCNKDIYYANALINLNSFDYKDTNIFGAIILKWLRQGKISIKNQNSGIFDKNSTMIDLSSNPTFDLDIEEKLFNMMYEASKDGMLQPKELERWAKNHYQKFLNLFDKIKNSKIDELESNGHIYKRTSKQECKKKHVMDDMIYNDSKELYGLKLFLKEFSDMNSKEAIEVKLWDEYLMFAYLFGMAAKVAKQFKNLYPEIVREMEINNLDYDTFLYINNFSVNTVHAASAARSAAQSYNSGGGGFSSGGGGGGSFGGGGSMGGR